MPSYVLNARQRRRFKDIVDLYQPIDQVSDAADLVTEIPMQVQRAATFTGISCALESKKEASVPLPIGRSNYDITDTTDTINFHNQQQVGDGWFVLLKTPNHPENGTWYTIQGEAQYRTFRAESQTLLLKKATAPPFAS